MDMYNKKEEYETKDVLNEARSFDVNRYIKKNTFDDSDVYIWIDDTEHDDFEEFDGLDSSNTE